VSEQGKANTIASKINTSSTPNATFFICLDVTRMITASIARAEKTAAHVYTSTSWFSFWSAKSCSGVKPAVRVAKFEDIFGLRDQEVTDIERESES